MSNSTHKSGRIRLQISRIKRLLWPNGQEGRTRRGPEASFTSNKDPNNLTKTAVGMDFAIRRPFPHHESTADAKENKEEERSCCTAAKKSAVVVATQCIEQRWQRVQQSRVDAPTVSCRVRGFGALSYSKFSLNAPLMLCPQNPRYAAAEASTLLRQARWWQAGCRCAGTWWASSSRAGG